jgi:hypothetical protein
MEKLYLSYLLEKSNYSTTEDWNQMVTYVSKYLTGEFTLIELSTFVPLGVMTYQTFQKSNKLDQLLG